MKIGKHICFTLITWVLAIIHVSCAKGTVSQGFDWPCWRGPNGNGVSEEKGWNPRALEGGAKVLWTTMIGTGYSNIAISKSRIYAMGSADSRHLMVTCLDADTGRLIWKQILPFDAGGEPESTPAVDGDRVYGIAQNGMLFCLDSADRSVLWRKNIKAMLTNYGIAGSPVVEGSLLLINMNLAGIALDKASGELVWDSGMEVGSGPVAFETICGTYASPLVFDVQGQRIALFLGWTALSAVEPATGKVLWSIAHKESYEVVADPVVAGKQVFFATLSSCSVIEHDAQGSPRVLWSGETLREGTATPVVVDGYLYGSDWDTFLGSWDWKAAQHREWPFRCIEVKTGKVAWTRPMSYVSLMAADGKLIMLDLKGTLSIAEASPKELKVLSSADVFAGANKPRLFPTAPVLCNGRIYCRNYAGDLICIDVSK